MLRDATQSGTAQDDKATSDKATSAVSTTDRTTNGEAMNDYAIGIDIGGTKVSGGVVDDRGRIVWRARRDTPERSKSPRVVEDTIVSVVHELLEAIDSGRIGEGPGQVRAVGIGAAGFVGADGATVVFAPHLSWRNEPLRDALTHRVGRPIFVENDANAAAWAEWRFGAAQGESHLVMITLGTGIGGGIVIDGNVQRGKWGIAAEFGHMQVVPDGQRCECGEPRFPRARICVRCGLADRFGEEIYAERGATLLTYTLDAFFPSPDPPTVVGVVQVNDGPRIHVQLTDMPAGEVRIGMALEFVLRRMHCVGGRPNYFWKCRPPGAAS